MHRTVSIAWLPGTACSLILPCRRCTRTVTTTTTPTTPSPCGCAPEGLQLRPGEPLQQPAGAQTPHLAVREGHQLLEQQL